MNTQKLEIRLAETAADRKACFELRYDVYVAELGRQLDKADHEARLLMDQEDSEAIIVGVFSGETAVATARLTMADAGSEFVGRYGLETQVTADNRVAVVSRLMIRPEYRGSGVFQLLVGWLFGLGSKLGVQHAYIECREHLIRLYETIGFKLCSKGTTFSLMGLAVGRERQIA